MNCTIAQQLLKSETARLVGVLHLRSWFLYYTQDKFHEEYPATPDEAFLSSGMRFFSPMLVLEAKRRGAAEAPWRGEIVDAAGEAEMVRRVITDEGTAA